MESGELVALLPGVLVPAGLQDREELRIRAVAAWDDDAVLTRWAAARLTFWPEIAMPMVTASVPRQRRLPRGFLLSEEELPRPLIRNVRGIRVTAPELTALALAVTDGGDAIERCLRTGLASIADLADALECTPRRRDNGKRRRALDAARHNPWSAAERQLHRLLRSARIDGWLGNCEISAGRTNCTVDVVFRAERVAIEAAANEFHRAERQAQFHRDRRKWTDLAAAGWIVLHFTWQHLTEDPDWMLKQIRRALALTQIRSAS